MIQPKIIRLRWHHFLFSWKICSAFFYILISFFFVCAYYFLILSVIPVIHWANKRKTMKNTHSLPTYPTNKKKNPNVSLAYKIGARATFLLTQILWLTKFHSIFFIRSYLCWRSMWNKKKNIYWCLRIGTFLMNYYIR